jgi:acyl-coenzyme A thioesterase PaaI-like protein
VGDVVRAGRRQVVARADVYSVGEQGEREHVATALATIAVLGQAVREADA